MFSFMFVEATEELNVGLFMWFADSHKISLIKSYHFMLFCQDSDAFHKLIFFHV